MITQNGTISYSIPKKIKTSLNQAENFYDILISNLNHTFGDSGWFDEDGFQVTGTTGWVDSLISALDACNLVEIKNYYNKLEWYDSDSFDYELGEELLKRV